MKSHSISIPQIAVICFLYYKEVNRIDVLLIALHHTVWHRILLVNDHCLAKQTWCYCSVSAKQSTKKNMLILRNSKANLRKVICCLSGHQDYAVSMMSKWSQDHWFERNFTHPSPGNFLVSVSASHHKKAMLWINNAKGSKKTEWRCIS